MAVSVLDIVGIALLLVLIVLVVRYRNGAPHNEYLRLLDDMPPYDHSDLALEELDAKIEETRKSLAALDALTLSQGEEDARRMLRRRITAIRLQLLEYEKLKRALTHSPHDA